MMALPCPPGPKWMNSKRDAERASLRIKRMNAIQAGVRAEWEYIQANREWEAQRRAALGIDEVSDDDAY